MYHSGASQMLYYCDGVVAKFKVFLQMKDWQPLSIIHQWSDIVVDTEK